MVDKQFPDKISVVRDQLDRVPVRTDHGGDNLDALDVEIIGRLI